MPMNLFISHSLKTEKEAAFFCLELFLLHCFGVAAPRSHKG